MKTKKYILLLILLSPIISAFSFISIGENGKSSLIIEDNITTPKSSDYNYEGHELKTISKDTIRGGVYANNGDFYGDSTSGTSNYTIPGESIKWARLYVGVWGGTEDYVGVVSASVNGNDLGNVNIGGTFDANPTYSQGTNVYGSGHGVWWISYNVTSHILPEAENNATASKVSGTIDGRLFTLFLVVVYENSSMPLTQYWINEGAVKLESTNPNTITCFNGSVTPDAINKAEFIYAISHGQEGEDDALYFNQEENTGGPNQIGGPDFAQGDDGWYFDHGSIDVTSLLITEDNYASFWYDGDSIRPAVAIMTLEFKPPSIDSPLDVYYQIGTTENTINWQASDSNPANYTIYQESAIFEEDAWNGMDITVDIDGLSAGVHNFTCFINNTFGEFVSDNVTVYVSNTITINHPLNISYYEGEKNQFIEWKPSSTLPDNYTIYRNSISINSSSWDGSIIKENITGLAVNLYNFTCWVNDTTGNWIQDDVKVTVLYDDIDPTINSPGDFDIEYGSTGNQIIWSAFDFNPEEYNITKDTVLVKEGDWNSTSEQIIINITDGLNLGVVVTYNLTVKDKNGNIATDEINITVVDTTKPVHTWNPPNIEVESGSIVEINWTGSDPFPMNYTIKLWPDYPILEVGSWETGVNITFEYETSGVGYVYLICYLNDTSGNEKSDWVKVTTFDTIKPVITNIVQCGSDEKVAWKATDLNPGTYKILQNDIQIKDGSWSNNEELAVLLEDYEAGTYNFTCIISDLGNNNIQNTVILTIKEDDSNDDDEDDDEPEPAIPGYNILIFICSICGLSMVLIKFRKNKEATRHSK